MPTAHRVACLRDDAVFIVFLYQRWCYPVDKKRANEYGIAYEREEAPAREEEEAAAAVAAAAAASAPLELREHVGLREAEGEEGGEAEEKDKDKDTMEDEDDGEDKVAGLTPMDVKRSVVASESVSTAE